MEEQTLPEQSFDSPIPGESMTAELGSRPWQSPPQYATVEEALGFYLPRLENEEIVDGLLDSLELGIPVVTIANAMQTGAVMEGMHSIDVGILILPALVEMISYIADEAGIKYTTGTEKKSKKPSDLTVQVALKRFQESEKNNKEKEDVSVEDVKSPEEEEKISGLMSRRMS